jgi:hypothetical protein
MKPNPVRLPAAANDGEVRKVVEEETSDDERDIYFGLPESARDLDRITGLAPLPLLEAPPTYGALGCLGSVPCAG